MTDLSVSHSKCHEAVTFIRFCVNIFEMKITARNDKSLPAGDGHVTLKGISCPFPDNTDR
ncbi:hypothetical protein DY252_21490 [Thalassospira indica]|uniref:Uncharacterized protein n=1 Tax=Thalassospira indica TaxID=1891279 RepID=A0ABN5NM65_9PROT|nr:hypothetical protein DY252_21490 [Thalassospira indica]